MTKRLRGDARAALLPIVRTRLQAGATWRDIADEFGLARGQTKHLMRDARQATGPERSTDDGPGEAERPAFSIATEVYRGTMPAKAINRYTGWWNLTGDFLVINDVHIPATNWKFAEMALTVAERELPRPRRLIIAGDLINGDALSRFQDLVLGTPLQDELTHAEAYLDYLAGYFDEIFFFRGNHESRLLYSLQGQIHAPQFRRMFTERDKVHFSMYPYMTVMSGGQPWHITHQRNYSQSPLTVARKMAVKKQSHVISAHQHHAAVGRDLSNRWTCIDSAGLHDSELMAYVMMEDSTAPVMNNSFVLLREGVGENITPPEYMQTNWARWLGAGAAAGQMG